MRQRHGQFIFSLCLVVGVVLLMAYVRRGQRVEEPPQIEVPVKPVAFKPAVAIPDPEPPKPLEAEKPATEAKKAPEVKEAETEEVKKKVDIRTAKYKAEKHEGKGFGSGDKKGFPSFWCDEPASKEEFLGGLIKVGVKDFIVLRGGKISGIVAFDSNKVLAFKNSQSSSSGGFQRVLSNEEAKALGIYQLEDIEDGDAVGFYLPVDKVKESLRKYLSRHRMNIGPEELNGFRCKYSRAGFEVTEVYNN